MKKNNKKGFTLVELIVVTTIMVMIMGAILNWIRPMNKFYQRTQALSDSNDIGSILMDYVDDELRYATNIIVLQDYVGVPKLNSQYLVDSTGKASFTGQVTNALIIDNNAIRGEQFKGYDANGNASHRKQARGCIIKADIKEDVGIDVDNLKCLGKEELYNDYGCHFDARMNILDNGSKNITIDMELTRPRFSGGVYVFDKFGFNQSRDFELVNVNLSGPAGERMNSAFYTSRGNGDPIDYNTFARTSNIGKLKESNDSPYTYILYNKQVPDAEKVKVNVYFEENDTSKSNLRKSWEFVSGKKLPAAEVDKLIQDGKNSEETYSENGEYKRRTFRAITTDNGESIEDYKTVGVTQDLTFYFRFNVEVLTTPTEQFEFYDQFDHDHKDYYATYNKYYLESQQPFYNPSTYAFSTGKVSFNGKGNGLAEDGYVFVGWNEFPTATGPVPDDKEDAKKAFWFVNDDFYTSGHRYYAIYEKMPTKELNFKGKDSFNIVIGTSITDNSKYQQMKQDAINKPPTPDERFDHFEVKDSSGNELGDIEGFNLADFEDGYTIEPVYVPDTHPGAYEVIITFNVQAYDNRFYINAGANGHFAVYAEDGTTPIIKEDYSRYGGYFASNTAPSVGTVWKLYVYDESPVSFGYAGKNADVTGNSAYVIEGTQSEPVLRKER